MREVPEALELVLEQARWSPADAGAASQRRETVRLCEALGRVLAVDVASDIDSPPHDKSLMDGAAVRAADVRRGARVRVLETVTAGDVPTRVVQPGTATRIMTGAPLPEGADAVVITEQLIWELDDPQQASVVFDLDEARAGQNLLRRAASMAAGEVIVSAGTRLRPIELGVLAEVGCAAPQVVRRPRIAILSTGNELVDADVRPVPGQIRNSNGYLLEALGRQAGGEVLNLGIARDQPQALENSIRQGLEADVLVLSGGVSAGMLDLVPATLAKAGVQEVFHKVRLKPGKPLWFGVLDSVERRRLVFGLPGNPVSSLVCFALFVRPALAAWQGCSQYVRTPRLRLPLAAPLAHRGDRPTYFPGRLTADGRAEPLNWKGSADQRTLVEADCLCCFASGDRDYEPGDLIEVILLD